MEDKIKTIEIDGVEFSFNANKAFEKEDFQWIWGVLSGFDKNIDIKEVLNYSLPYADSYEGFWKKPLSLQHPLASLEIVAWDSSSTSIISKDRKIINDFRLKFPLSEDLETYNES